MADAKNYYVAIYSDGSYEFCDKEQGKLKKMELKEIFNTKKKVESLTTECGYFHFVKSEIKNELASNLEEHWSDEATEIYSDIVIVEPTTMGDGTPIYSHLMNGLLNILEQK